jgi:hypothetical protein
MLITKVKTASEVSAFIAVLPSWIALLPPLLPILQLMLSSTTGRSAVGRPWLPDACAGIGMLRSPNADKPYEFTESKGLRWGKWKLKRDQWSLSSRSTPASRLATPEHIKVFAKADAAETWFEENDPEGVAFEYDVLDWTGQQN